MQSFCVTKIIFDLSSKKAPNKGFLPKKPTKKEGTPREYPLFYASSTNDEREVVNYFLFKNHFSLFAILVECCDSQFSV